VALASSWNGLRGPGWSGLACITTAHLERQRKGGRKDGGGYREGTPTRDDAVTVPASRVALILRGSVAATIPFCLISLDHEADFEFRTPDGVWSTSTRIAFDIQRQQLPTPVILTLCCCNLTRLVRLAATSWMLMAGTVCLDLASGCVAPEHPTRSSSLGLEPP